jgi:outer membrane protein OmpA-like peptidoglycan-associated protein
MMTVAAVGSGSAKAPDGFPLDLATFGWDRACVAHCLFNDDWNSRFDFGGTDTQLRGDPCRNYGGDPILRSHRRDSLTSDRQPKETTMRFSLTLPAVGLLALMIAGCGPNRLSQPMPGPTPESVAAQPGAAESMLNTGGRAGGPLVPGNLPPAGATAAVPPAAAAPAARDFTVYFEFAKASLTSDARTIIQQAAAAARQGTATHVSVVGHTDTVGSEKYNQRLSERRAAAVRKELIAQGVPAGEISASGRGQNDLAVPTADEVKEPRNRRAVITVGGPGA